MVWYAISPNEKDGRVIREAARRHEIEISEAQIRALEPKELSNFVQQLARSDERLLAEQRKHMLARKAIIGLLMALWAFVAYSLFSILMPALKSALYRPMLGGWWIMEHSTEISYFICLAAAGVVLWMVAWLIEHF